MLRVHKWCDKYKIELEALPKHFFVNDYAAAFLVVTDSNFCFIEPIIANPDVSPDDRAIGISQVSNQCEQLAKKLGFKKVYGMTNKLSMLKHAAENGYKPSSTPYLVEKEL